MSNLYKFSNVNNNSKLKQNLKTLFCLSVSVITIYEYYWLITVFPGVPFYQRILFLTIFSLFSNLFFFTIKFLMFFKGNIMSENIERNFFRLNFCLSFLVFILYWGMIFTNKDGVIAKGIVIPPLLDFLMHGGNFFVNLVAHLIIIEQNEENLFFSWKFFLFISFFYTTFYKVIYFIFNYSVYPLVALMDIWLYFLLIFIATVLFLAGEFLFFKSLSIRNKLK